MKKKILAEFYVLTFLRCFGHSMTVAMYVSFLTENGLDLFQISLVNFTFFTTLAIAEIPTGAFADVFGRKLSFIVSCLLFAISMFVYGSSNSISGFILAEMICAIGATFSSGAFESWFIDRLEHHGYKKDKAKVFARQEQIEKISTIFSGLIGAVIADYNMSWTYFVGGLVALVTALVALFFKEEYFVKQKFSLKKNLEEMRTVVKSSVRQSWVNPNIRFIFVLVLAQVFVFQAPNMQWQPYFKTWLSSQTSMGFIYTLVSIAMLMGSFCAPYMLRKIKSEKKTLLIIQILIALGIIFTVIPKHFFLCLLAFLFHELCRGMFKPIKNAYLHDSITKKERATIQSIESMAHHIGGAVGLLITGLLAKKFGIQITWIICGTLLIYFSINTWRNNKNKFS